MPPKKRRILRTPRKAANPIPPPPSVPAAAETLAITTQSPPPLVSDAGPSTPPSNGAGFEPSTRSIPTADTKPSTPPPAPDAAAKTSPVRKVRKIIKKVIIKKIVPKGTFAARKAAAAAAAAAADASEPGGETPTDMPANDHNAATNDAVGKGHDANGTVVEKPATDCNAIDVEEALGEETVVEETLDGKLATDCDACMGEEVGMSEWQKRRMTEVFVGGLDRDAKEKDVRAVFAKAGAITEVRMIMDHCTQKNKGYCFVRYRNAAQAKKAIAEFGNVKICGKLCRAAARDGSDRIFLGNIDKKWKKEDIIKLLQKIGVENVDTVTLMADSDNPDCNCGFAFLKLETSRVARMAYKKLSKKNVFGKGLNIRVAWAEPLNDPDEKDRQKVKSIFVEGIPTSWDQAKLTQIFKKYGKIECVVLSSDMQSAKRKDFAFINYKTHEAAILCLESFNKEESTENGSKVNIKVSLAKPVQKGKQNKEDHKFSISEKVKTVAQSEKKVGPSSVQIRPSRVVQTAGDNKSCTTHDLLHVPREQTSWRHGHIGSVPDPIQDHTDIYSGEKRPFSTLDDDSSYPTRGHSRPRHESSTYTTATSSYGVLPPAITRSSPPYYHDNSRYPAGLASFYGVTGPSVSFQMRQADSRQPEQPYRSRYYSKYFDASDTAVTVHQDQVISIVEQGKH